MHILKRRDLLQQMVRGILGSVAVPGLELGLDSQAGKSPSWAGELHLDRNENADGPAPSVLAALQQSLGQANRYPRKMGDLQEALARKHGLKPEQVLLGCGSSDLIRMAVGSYLDPKRNLVVGSPSLELAPVLAEGLGAKVIRVALRKDYSYDLEAMQAKCDGQTGLVYICNPNNPTGTLTDRRALEAFLGKLPLEIGVVLDEAYHDYSGGSRAYHSFIEKRLDRENLVILRTFSKVYGLAGLRIGYGVANPATAARMTRQHLQFTEGTLAITAALAALADQSYLARSVERNENQRQEFLNQVNARMLRALDSHTNFVCVNVMHPLKPILEHFEKHRVFLGPKIPELPNHLRVSLGTADEMREFWRVWDMLGLHPMAM
ncbi:MAG TPA: aminotransferase class I/II-fold pyridoxal phosphate-dependent enzyme [Candidatus Saccharimonadales bacterium]|nr:aminotransferase class I/II-fold pyridoxal phosphate-dependent enzyme [Candidatus Saccharimonadales bacterium]